MKQPEFIIQINGDHYYLEMQPNGLGAKLTTDINKARKLPNGEAHYIRNHLAGLGMRRPVVVPAEVTHG